MTKPRPSMISKIKTGSGFKGAISYVLDKKESELIHRQSIYSEDAKDIALEMRMLADARNISKPVLHVSLSLPIGKATDEQWKLVAETYLKKMGFDLEKTQYIVARHNDTKHDHIHIVANRVQLDGELVSDRYSYRRSHEATAEAARIAGLELSQEQLAELDHKGKLYQLRQQVNQALTDAESFNHFKSILKANGIQLKFNHSKTTGYVSGLSYETTDGRSWKASALGKDYTLKGLAKQGLHADASITRRSRVPDTSVTNLAKDLLRNSKVPRQNSMGVTDSKNRYETDKWLAERASENAKTEAEQDRAARQAEYEDEDEM